MSVSHLSQQQAEVSRPLVLYLFVDFLRSEEEKKGGSQGERVRLGGSLQQSSPGDNPLQDSDILFITAAAAAAAAISCGQWSPPVCHRDARANTLQQLRMTGKACPRSSLIRKPSDS